MPSWMDDPGRIDAIDREGILYGMVKGSPKSRKKRKRAFNLTEAFSMALEELNQRQQKQRPSVRVHRSGAGRNPHVGLNIPKTTNEEVVARRRAHRATRSRGQVRAVNRRN